MSTSWTQGLSWSQRHNRSAAATARTGKAVTTKRQPPASAPKGARAATELHASRSLRPLLD
eukprot:14022539-Alexandrium_andersonii.AAC.1